MIIRRQVRTEIGNQGEENVRVLITQHYPLGTFQVANGQGGHPDLYFISDEGRICIEVKSMLPFSVDRNRYKKKIHKIGYTHLSRTEWALMGEFARSRIASMCIIIEVRFKSHPYIYFVLERSKVDKWIEKVKQNARWIDIPLWYIFENGYALGQGTLDFTPVQTTQIQLGEEKE